MRKWLGAACAQLPAAADRPPRNTARATTTCAASPQKVCMADRFPHESRFRSALRVAGTDDAAFNVRQAARELQVDLDVRFESVPHLFVLPFTEERGKMIATCARF